MSGSAIALGLVALMWGAWLVTGTIDAIKRRSKRKGE